PAQVAADLHTSLDSYLITGVTAGNQLTGGGTSGTVTLNVSEGSGSGLDADYVDGLHAYRFLRSDASDTFTASSLTLDSGAYLKTRMIGSLGTELGIGAGEMWSTMNGNITGETLWLGGESGVKIVSSPDNMSSGWTGRHEASLVNTAGDSTFPGDVTADAFYYNSDKRLKDNIVSLGSESLAVIDKLNPVSFTWKEDGTASQGFIAQEIEQVLPELVRADEASGMKSVQYANLTAVLTAGMKTQQEKINDLETELEILKIQLNSLKNN
ncbi:MAG TPA: tail fiber domain-containing protein, partial [Patescibacteria group bacterium]|nr:tail fiber domain-containing protein [Patescibacteria group bacterium]